MYVILTIFKKINSFPDVFNLYHLLLVYPHPLLIWSQLSHNQLQTLVYTAPSMMLLKTSFKLSPTLPSNFSELGANIVQISKKGFF